MTTRFFSLSALISLSLLAALPAVAQQGAMAPESKVRSDPNDAQALARSQSPTALADAMLMLDYQVVPVVGNKSIDLIGFQLLNKFNDWLSR